MAISFLLEVVRIGSSLRVFFLGFGSFSQYSYAIATTLTQLQKQNTKLHIMWGLSKNSSELSNKKQEKERGLAESFRPENFIPGLIIGFIFGLFLDLSSPSKKQTKKKNFLPEKSQQQYLVSSNGDRELKMVLVVRQDLKMGAGKIASQCAHAATGMYAELMQSDWTLLRQWEQSGQPKIVVTCKNQQEMNKLREAAESVGLPTFVVADAGRTQVSAGSKTVLAVGPGPKSAVDSVTGKLRLL